MNAAAIIAAAGAGRRMGGVRKAFMTAAGKPLLQHSLDVFLAHPGISTVIVVLAGEDAAAPPAWLRDSRVTIVSGGAERADSVRAGLDALPQEVDAVVVHDAARPLITPAFIDAVLAEIAKGRSATIAAPLTDTLHEADADQNICATPDRSRFWRAQTPQAFPRDVLELAFARAPNASTATDEAGLVASGGWPVRIVPGAAWNIKVTTPEDMPLLEAAFRERDA